MTPSNLYTDLDGTLICKGDISRENRQAIRRFVDAGGGFSVATGRSEVTALPFARQLPLTLPAIVYNGAAVYDFQTAAFLHTVYLTRAVFTEMVAITRREFPEVTIQAFTGGPAVMLSPPENVDPYVLKEGQAVRYAAGPEECDECFKLLFYGDPTRLPALEALFRQRDDGTFLCTYSAPYYLEVLPRGATKGDALTWLLGYLGKEREEFAAIGDFDNDVTMITVAGLGAAPADARLCAREAADVVVAPHTDSAVASLIEQYLMK